MGANPSTHPRGGSSRPVEGCARRLKNCGRRPTFSAGQVRRGGARRRDLAGHGGETTGRYAVALRRHRPQDDRGAGALRHARGAGCRASAAHASEKRGFARSAGVAIQRPPGGRVGASRATRTVGLASPRVAAALRPLARPPPDRPTFPSIPAARPWRVRPPPARARPALRRDTGRRRAAAPRPPRRGCARRRRAGRTPARRRDTSSRRR